MYSFNLNFIVNSLLLTTSSKPEPYVIAFTSQTAVQVILHMVLVLVLFYLLGKILFKPIRKILEERKSAIASEYEKIETTSKEVEQLKIEYEAKLKDINKEADQILTHARKRAAERRDELIGEAKDEASLIMKRTELEIQREKAALKDDVKKEIITVATLMASKYISDTIDEETKVRLLDKTITDMGEDTWLA